MAAKQPKQPKKPLTLTQFKKAFAAASGLSAHQVEKVGEALTKLLKQQLGKRGPGTLAVFGLLKFRTVRKRATRARRTINPFTLQPLEILGKPAKTLVRVRPLKKLQALVN